MQKFIDKYRLYFSAVFGALITVLVILLWVNNQKKVFNDQLQKIDETSNLITQQFQKAVQDNINMLSNLRNRIEVSEGDYFEYWEFDANQVAQQDSSFLFVEWIDSNGIIRRVAPEEGNQSAIGLNILTLDYRREEWLTTKADSSINFTHWLELVQGRFAFLVDMPMYYNGQFQGTLTAGIDIEPEFDNIMRGLGQYHVEVKDGRGNTFYTSTDHESPEFYPELVKVHKIELRGTNSDSWEVSIYPNENFESQSAIIASYLNLALALILGIAVSVLFYFMRTAFLAQKKERQANEKIRALIDSAPVAIYAIDTDGVIKDFWNTAAENMLGWSREEVMGKFMPHVEGEWTYHFHELMKKTLEDGLIRNKEIVRNRKDGTPVYLRLNVGRIVRDRSNHPLMLAILEDITKEKEYQQQLENSVQEKEVLLSEIHHRVKNNLAIIAGLIELQNAEVENPELKDILSETQNRIYSISGVHELLYNTDNFTDITFEEYAEKLIDRIQSMFQKKSRDIKIRYDFGNIQLNINQAIPLGLLLNELITNTFKHAFGNRNSGEIRIKFEQIGQKVDVTYKDNGSGFDRNLFSESKTLGVTLIKTLIEQLGAEYSLESEHGFLFRFSFNLDNVNKKRGAYSNM